MIDSGQLNAENTTLIRCLYLLGLFAQHAKIDEHAELFNAALGAPKNVSLTGLIAKSLAAFAKPVVQESLRKTAITSYGTWFIVRSDLGFLCLGNTEFFKMDTDGTPQIITSSLRDGSMALKRTVSEIFQEYFSIEEYKAEAREGIKMEDVDLTTDFDLFTGTSSNIGTDEYNVAYECSNYSISFFLAGNYLGDIMDCTLSDFAPLAITGMEVLECIARGGLAAPSDVLPHYTVPNFRSFLPL